MHAQQDSLPRVGSQLENRFSSNLSDVNVGLDKLEDDLIEQMEQDAQNPQTPGDRPDGFNAYIRDMQKNENQHQNGNENENALNVEINRERPISQPGRYDPNDDNGDVDENEDVAIAAQEDTLGIENNSPAVQKPKLSMSEDLIDDMETMN